MCSAIPLRIAVIGSNDSPAAGSPASATGAGAGFGAAGAAGAARRSGRGLRLRGRCGRSCGLRLRDGAGAGAGGASGSEPLGGACPPPSTNARMSFFVTRPPAPVPCTALVSTPCSDAIRATTGETNVRPLPSACPAAGSAQGGRRCRRRRRRRRLRRLGRGRLGRVGRVLGRRLGRRFGGRRFRGCRRGHLGAFRSDHREHGADLDRLAFLHEDLRDDALARARHLGVDLVGRDLEQRLVARDRLAFLLEPLRDRPLRDGHAHLRHDDLDLCLRSHQLS